MTKIAVRTPQDIGALIRSRRRSIGLTQAELANKLGLSRLWITEIERGKPGASLVLVLRALSALGLELVTDDEGKRVNESQSILSDALLQEVNRRVK